MPNGRAARAWAAGFAAFFLTSVAAYAQKRDASAPGGPAAAFSQILGRPTGRSVALSILSAREAEIFVEYGVASGRYTVKTPTATAKAKAPLEFELSDLQRNTRYFYRVCTRAVGATEFQNGEECTFHTQRPPTAKFIFALQGDSHPERDGKMFNADLYVQTMHNAAKDAPDFYIMMGDDFSIEGLISRNTLSAPAVDAIYAYQRGFVGLVGRSAALFLVNGNHEEAAKYLLDGKANNAAVLAGRARTRFFPLPAPDAFYSGDAEPVEHIGLLRDYYAWTWGDALFVVIDPYWHSDVTVDAEAGGRKPDRGNRKGGGGGKRDRDMWSVTLGDAQYHWLEKTLRESDARFKFVFCHHVLGTGRGGIEIADEFEWGGHDRRGTDQFAAHRPNWRAPIHALFRQYGVTIFFQGHDHLYARQELDGVIYQSVPNPADSTFQAFNREAYGSGEIRPNSGHLRVTVSPESARVEYIQSFRPEDEREGRSNGAIAHAYTVAPRTRQPRATTAPADSAGERPRSTQPGEKH